MKKLNQDGHVDFVYIDKFDKQKYHHYASMTPSERKSLTAINLWRQKNGIDIISVPPEDYYYEHYFQGIDQIEQVNSKKKSKPL